MSERPDLAVAHDLLVAKLLLPNGCEELALLLDDAAMRLVRNFVKENLGVTVIGEMALTTQPIPLGDNVVAFPGRTP